MSDNVKAQATKIHADVDFDQDGKQTGFLRLLHSVHRSAYGWIPIPIVCLKNGSGPTVLLMSGNHGDEYEGQVTLSNLCQELEIEDIQGRIIILPMANFPAAKAGLRTSPLDEGNLNRSFPGAANGNPTQMMAHYIETVLMVMADYVLDLHSGGSSLHYLPTILVGKSEDPEVNEKTLGIVTAFGAPYGFIFPQSGEPGVSSAAARRQGALPIGTEMGGSGTVTPDILALLQRAVRRALAHLKVWSGQPPAPESVPTRLLGAPSHEYFCYADEDGLFEPTVELGDIVSAGQLAGYIHTPETPWRAPTAQYFTKPGLVICKRIPGRSQRGDCLFHLGIETDVTADAGSE